MNSDTGTGSNTQDLTPSLLIRLEEAVHALAQPLTIAQGTLEVASTSASTLDEYRQAVGESLSEIGRAVELLSYIRDVMKLARGSETREPVSLHSVMAETT